MKKKRGTDDLGLLGTVGHFLNYTTSLGGKASQLITRFLRFGTSSSFTLLIDIFLLAIFVESFNLTPYIASGLSFAISTSINYVINREWGFKGTLTGILKGYFIFILFSVMGIGITVGLMWLFVSYLGLFYIIARIFVAIIEGTFSFIMHINFTFKMPHVLHIRQHHFGYEHKELTKKLNKVKNKRKGKPKNK